jgi:hypothetical protein
MRTYYGHQPFSDLSLESIRKSQTFHWTDVGQASHWPTLYRNINGKRACRIFSGQKWQRMKIKMIHFSGSRVWTTLANQMRVTTSMLNAHLLSMLTFYQRIIIRFRSNRVMMMMVVEDAKSKRQHVFRTCSGWISGAFLTLSTVNQREGRLSRVRGKFTPHTCLCR